MEYLPGEEENIKELKDISDKIILGQHFIYDDNKELRRTGDGELTGEELIQYAKYIDKAMELNIPDIIAHPDFFMKKRKKKFGEIEAKAAHMICKSAKKYNIPIEINLNNIFNHTYYENNKYNQDSIEKQKEKLENVEYPCKEFWEIVAKYDVKVLFGIDVHHRGQILVWNELVELATTLLGKEIIEKLHFVEE